MSPASPAAAILPAAGSGSRVGADRNKLLLDLAGEPLLLHTLRAVAACDLAQVVLVTRPAERDLMADLARRAGLDATFADGGASRQESVANGLAALRAEIELVAVHDGARPLVTPELFDRCLAAAAEHGAAVAAVPVADTLKRVADGQVGGSVDRDGLWAMQTPQAFQVGVLRSAAEAARSDGFVGTDEVSLVERMGRPVVVVPSGSANLKVTQPEDYDTAAAHLAARKEARMTTRIGFGYDVHQMVAGRELWLGGVRIEADQGLLGHSDADVLLHAICDALLGAVGAGDIGRHFPDTSPEFAGIRSMRLLEATYRILCEAGYRVVNVDATVVAERPRLAPHVPAMIDGLAATLEVAPDCINIKATTHEKLGALGAGEGMAAHAVASVVQR